MRRRRVEQPGHAGVGGTAAVSRQEAQRHVQRARGHEVELEVRRKAPRTGQQEFDQVRDRFVDLFEHAPIGYVTLDSNAAVRAANLMAAGLLGIARSELIGRRLAAFVSPDFQDTLRRHRERVLAGSGAYGCDLILRRADGALLSVRMESVCEQDVVSGERLCKCVIIDIDERTRAEERLRQSEERFRKIYENAQLGIAITDAAGRFEICNPAYCAMLGYDESELRQITFASLVHPEDRVANLARNEDLESGRVASFNIENRYVRKDGRTIWVRKAISTLPGDATTPMRFIAVVEDVTERRRMRHALYERERQLQLALDAAGAGTWYWDVETGQSGWDDRFHAMYRFSPEDPRSRDAWIGRLHPSDRALVLERIDQALKVPDTDKWDAEFRVRLPDGTERWMRALGGLQRGVSGRVTRISGINLDVTGERRTERALFQAIIRVAHESVLIVDEQGTVESINPAGLRMLDCVESAVIGQSVDELLEWGAQTEMEAPVRFLSVRATQSKSVPATVRARLAERHSVEASFIGFEWSGRRRYIVVLRDVSLQRRVEAQLREHLEDAAQRHRLGMAGQLAGALAHQLNQPLAAILGFAEAARARIRRGQVSTEKFNEAFAEIADQANRAAQSIRELRRFLSREEGEMVSGDLNTLVRRACTLAQGSMQDAGISLRLTLMPNLPWIRMFPAQLEQVVLLLIDNAIDAISEAVAVGVPRRIPKGSIEVETTLGHAGSVLLRVRDTGPGLSEEDASRVFEPLYTTKKTGIGLGLPIAKSIVESHGGSISARTGPGGKFEVALPVAA